MDKIEIGAWANIKYNGEKEIIYCYFSFDEGYEPDEKGNFSDCFGIPDDQIFFFCKGRKDLESMKTQGVNDFTVINYEVITRKIKI